MNSKKALTPDPLFSLAIELVEDLIRLRTTNIARELADYGVDDIYRAICHFVMRLIVIRWAEAKRLLPSHQSFNASAPRCLSELVEHLSLAQKNTSAWKALLDLLHLIESAYTRPTNSDSEADPELLRLSDNTSPAKGGIWNPLFVIENQLPYPENIGVYHFLNKLESFAKLTNAPTESIGSIYEKLLSYTLKRGNSTPAHLNLVRWNGHRKHRGSFYTIKCLAEPTVSRTLAPLLYTKDQKLRPPTELTRLRVCDPAMGAGSFIIASLRILTQAVHRSFELSPRPHRPDTFEAQVDSFSSREEQTILIRHMIATHCLFGVDVDPTAVALARVILWLEVAKPTTSPYSFSGTLKCGNALISGWRTLVQRYPVRAFDRESPDKKHHLGQHPLKAWHHNLRKKRAEIIAADNNLKKSNSPPDSHTSEERLRYDAWTSLWFWPLDQIETAPSPTQWLTPSPETQSVIDNIRSKLRFFHWELEFSDVFLNSESPGFDAVLGNPPWEIMKPNSKEFFSRYDSLYNSYAKQNALEAQKNIFSKDKETELKWLNYNGFFRDFSHYMRNMASPSHTAPSTEKPPLLHIPFQYQGSGDPNTYKMFVELGYHLLKPGGQLGMIVPSSLHTDRGAAILRKLLLENCGWHWLYGYENRHKIFAVDGRFKFDIIIIEKAGQSDYIYSTFMRHEPQDWQDAAHTLRYPTRNISLFSPASLSIPEINSEQSLDVLTRIYATGILLGHPSLSIKNNSGLHMTSDSARFIERDQAEREGYIADGYGRWSRPDGHTLLPLYEGRMIGQYDFSEKGWVKGRARSSVWRTIPWSDKCLEPQFLVPAQPWEETAGRSLGTRLAYMAVGSATNQRSMLAAFIRRMPCGNAVPTLNPTTGLRSSLMLAAAMNSFVFDFALRTKLGGLNLNYFLISEIPVLPLSPSIPELVHLVARLSFAHPWFIPSWIELMPKAPESISGPRNWPLTPRERLRLRCQIDAIVALLYGLSPADFAWILRDCDHPAASLAEESFCRELDPKGFWRVDKTHPPELRHTVLSFVAFMDLLRHVEIAKDIKVGIGLFCSQNNGEGWVPPSNIHLESLSLTRTVNKNTYSLRSCQPQPTLASLGPKRLDWQHKQSPDESRALFHKHAEHLKSSNLL